MTQDEEWILREKYNGEKTEGFFADCARLQTGEPLAYIIGTIPFLHTTISLDSHPLIPRTETEFWVAEILPEIKEREAHGLVRILDLCAGSGCIGVAVLAEAPSVRVDFAEIDTHHHTTIQKNITANGIDPARTRIMGGDLFAEITQVYDYILTNPPYIDPALDRTTESVQSFEPKIALYGGVSGMEYIDRIITEAPKYLNPHGTLIIEHEPEQALAIAEKARAHNFNVSTHTDQFGVLRYTVLVRKIPDTVSE